jgi:hypothetical protein
VFGGTNILQHTERSEGEGVNERSVKCSTVQCFLYSFTAPSCVVISNYGKGKSVFYSLFFHYLFLSDSQCGIVVS